jgi:AcrR family transcriptional regulator
VTTSQRTRRRADAERNIARILAATRTELGADPTTSTDDIARAAGVGRMTLYGHFRTRADLVDAALEDAIRVGDEVLREVDLSGDPVTAMRALLRSSWTVVVESEGLLAAAEDVLPAPRIRELHEGPARRLEQLVRRGQRAGAFREDLPAAWMVSAVHYLLHGAAAEVRAGRLKEAKAADVVTRTVESVLQPAPVDR